MSTGVAFKVNEESIFGNSYENFKSISALLKKIENIGKGDYVVMVCGKRNNTMPDSVLVVSLSGKEPNDIKRDFFHAISTIKNNNLFNFSFPGPEGIYLRDYSLP